MFVLKHSPLRLILAFLGDQSPVGTWRLSTRFSSTSLCFAWSLWCFLALMNIYFFLQTMLSFTFYQKFVALLQGKHLNQPISC